jgi:hypothetical protein
MGVNWIQINDAAHGFVICSRLQCVTAPLTHSLLGLCRFEPHFR